MAEKQRYVSEWDTDGVEHDKDQILGHEKTFEIAMRNPEEAAHRGLWDDVEFLKKVWDNNGKNKDTQFADYHGHGWNFRAIFKRDRKGRLLDEKGQLVADNDPDKFKKAVHMASIHVDKGMHCVDCHFEQDAHGNGHLYGEVAQAVIPLCDARASALQFRYFCVTDADALKVVDVTNPSKPRLVKDAVVPLKEANRIYVARTYAYVAAGSERLAIVDVEKPEHPKLNQKFTAGGQINDVRDIVIGTTNASLFAYIADGKNGLRVLQLTSPDSQPGF